MFTIWTLTSPIHRLVMEWDFKYRIETIKGDECGYVYRWYLTMNFKCEDIDFRCYYTACYYRLDMRDRRSPVLGRKL